LVNNKCWETRAVGRIIVLQGLGGLIEERWDGFRGFMSDCEAIGWILRD